MRSQAKATTVIAALTVLASLAAQPAAARTVANTHDGKPNILVVMTDDQALNDIYATTTNGVKAMPNLQSLIAANGVTFNNAVDSFPLCCPSRATFLTGEYSHNHGVGGNFWPYGWYGMSGRNNTLPVWLHSAGYYTAAVGKWLNGYGAGTPADTDAQGNPLKKNGEIPSGFDNWNGAIDVSAYDYFNLALNQNGKTKYWGDSNYSKALNNFARIQVKGPASKSIITVLNWAAQYFGGTKKTIGEMFARAADPTTYGKERSADYSPDVTAGISDSIIKTQTKSKKPFFLWWSPAAPHREDVNGGIRNGNRAGVHFRAKAGNPHVEDTTKIVPDPRPAPRYASLNWDWSKITSKPNYDQAPTDKPSAQQQLLANSVNTPNPVASLPTKAKQLQADYNGRLGGIKAVDDGIKKLVARLKATGQYNNTLIIFTSDNGWLQGEHRVPGDKYLPYEESVRVPLVMSGPGISGGRQINTQVSNIDFASTILQAAGASSGRTQDGISLLGAAKGTSTLPDRAIELEANAPLFADASMPQQWDQPYRGVRTNDWKYVVWGTGEKELYDLHNDPYELTNLADNPTYAATQASLAAKLETLKTCAGASCQVSP